MFSHHQAAVAAITDKLKKRRDVLGVIIGGSVAHGYASENSDIDIMIVLSDKDWSRAMKEHDMAYFETESTPYEGGYVDGKMICPDYIKKVGQLGCEPARFAFKDAFASYDGIGSLDALIKEAARYPEENREENMNKFYAQFETWKWYYYEGEKRGNRFLTDYCISNYVLSAGRLILAYNRLLYPSYKWFLRVLEDAPEKPEGFMAQLNAVIEKKDAASIEALYQSAVCFHDWYRSDKHFSVQFMIDSQLNFLEGNGSVPVLDL